LEQPCGFGNKQSLLKAKCAAGIATNILTKPKNALFQNQIIWFVIENLLGEIMFAFGITTQTFLLTGTMRYEESFKN
jgi:hypothetical protein